MIRKELLIVDFEAPGLIVDNLLRAQANAMIAKNLTGGNVGLDPGENRFTTVSRAPGCADLGAHGFQGVAESLAMRVGSSTAARQVIDRFSPADCWQLWGGKEGGTHSSFS